MFKQKEVKYEMKLLSSLAKVFQDEMPVYRPECLKLSALWGETVSFQAAYTGDFFLLFFSYFLYYYNPSV